MDAHPPQLHDDWSSLTSFNLPADFAVGLPPRESLRYWKPAPPDTVDGEADTSSLASSDPNIRSRLLALEATVEGYEAANATPSPNAAAELAAARRALEEERAARTAAQTALEGERALRLKSEAEAKALAAAKDGERAAAASNLAGCRAAIII